MAQVVHLQPPIQYIPFFERYKDVVFDILVHFTNFIAHRAIQRRVVRIAGRLDIHHHLIVVFRQTPFVLIREFYNDIEFKVREYADSDHHHEVIDPRVARDVFEHTRRRPEHQVSGEYDVIEPVTVPVQRRVDIDDGDEPILHRLIRIADRYRQVSNDSILRSRYGNQRIRFPVLKAGVDDIESHTLHGLFDKKKVWMVYKLREIPFYR